MRKRVVLLALLCSLAIAGPSLAVDIAAPRIGEANIGDHFDRVVVYDKTIHDPGDGYDVIFHFDSDAAGPHPPTIVGCRVPRLDPLRVERMDFVSKRVVLWTQVTGTVSNVTPAAPPRVPGGPPEAGTIWLKYCRFNVVNWTPR